MLEKARDYVEDCTQYGDVVPITAGLSLVLGVNRSTLYEWAGEHPEFSNMLDALQAKQEKELAANGLQSIFNPVITKLMLAKHGYTDKVDHTTKGKELPTPILGGISMDDQEREAKS